MADCWITCIVHDDKKVIIKVGIAGRLYTVQHIVNCINGKTDTFYTMAGGKRADVYAKKHPTSGRWFLTTKPDSLDENNLDFLPQC